MLAFAFSKMINNLKAYISEISVILGNISKGNLITSTSEEYKGNSIEKMCIRDRYFEPMFVSIYYFIASFVQIGLAVVVAYLVSFGCKASNFFKSVYFFPSLINSVAISFIFIFFFQPGSTLDTVLNSVGLGGLIKYWLKDPNIINVSMASVSVWRYIGYNICLLYTSSNWLKYYS